MIMKIDEIENRKTTGGKKNALKPKLGFLKVQQN